MECIRVVVADDHPLIRSGIRRELERADDIEVVGEASDGVEALSMVADVNPDVLLLDVEMPRKPGIEVARELSASGSEVRILALSAHDDEQYVFGLLESGASGYLVKDEIPQAIVDAVRGVARGEDGWLSRKVAATLMHRRSTESEAETALQVLSEREIEVLRHVAEGLDNQEIGKRLFISESTVKSHCNSIYQKLGVRNRVQAAAWAWQRGVRLQG